MSRRVRQRVEEDGKEKVGSPSYLVICDEDVAPKSVDWTSLIHDAVVHVFTLLDYRDRASLASTCKTLRDLGASPYLWSSLDLRPYGSYRFDVSIAASIANRCGDLHKVKFYGLESADALVNLKARKLREIICEHCEDVTDATLPMIVARHEALESLELGPVFGRNITSEAIKVVATCCPKLKKLRLSRMRDVNSEAILSLAKNCSQLSDVGFLDCENINGEALGEVVSLRYLSVTGVTNLNWRVATARWEKLPNLTALDVSRTSIDHVAVSRLLKSSQSLKVVCALNCPMLEHDPDFNPERFEGKRLITKFNNTISGIAYIFADNSKMTPKVEETARWLEWSLSRTLLFLAESSSPGLSSFWQSHGAKVFLKLMQSTQEDVQERATSGLAAFIHVDDVNDRVEAVMREGGIPVLLKLTKSLNEDLQIELARVIANLSLNAKAAKAVAEGGGVDVLVGLAKSKNRYVAQEAAGGLWSLSLGDAYMAIAQAGGVNVLLELLSRWQHYGELLERAAGALANLAGDNKCSSDIARAGGVHALVVLARRCDYEEVEEQAARGLANLAGHDDDSNSNNAAAIGKEPGALKILIQMTRSDHEGVKLEAAGALWNLAYDSDNRKLIAKLRGVHALVALARSCLMGSTDLQEKVAGALWGLANSEENSIAIGHKGGIRPLVALARSESEDVHKTAAGALWNLSFSDGNALRIVKEKGVTVLAEICTTSPSKMARFLAALTLAYIYDGRLGQSTSTSVALAKDEVRALQAIRSFLRTFMTYNFVTAASKSFTPSMLAQVLEKARIPEADIVRCSGGEIGRFVAMLQKPSPVFKEFAAFALLQFTIPGASHAKHHANLLMQNAGDVSVLRTAASSIISMTREAKIFVKTVLHNLEHHQAENV